MASDSSNGIHLIERSILVQSFWSYRLESGLENNQLEFFEKSPEEEPFGPKVLGIFIREAHDCGVSVLIYQTKAIIS